jgi:glutamate-1-semialdehyde aminotransferase
MTISDFALRYQKTITLNYDQMMETHKALSARLTHLLESGVSLNDDQMRTTLIVAGILDELIEEGTLACEAEVAAQEARDLDDPDKLGKFLEGEGL